MYGTDGLPLEIESFEDEEDSGEGDRNEDRGATGGHIGAHDTRCVETLALQMR